MRNFLGAVERPSGFLPSLYWCDASETLVAQESVVSLDWIWLHINCPWFEYVSPEISIIIKSVSKVLGQMWALLALGWVSQDF